jgi:hypothetical protein
MVMPALMVFISSTFLEFKTEREQLHRILTKVLPVACNLPESLTSDTSDLQKYLHRRIEKADVIILLLGIRYGSLKGEIAWIEEEIRFAHKRGKKILPYLKQQERPPEIADLDERKQKALDSFIQFVKDEIAPNIPRFSDLLELVALVVRDVAYETDKRYRDTYEESFD